VGRLIDGPRPPDALYLDDSRAAPLPELWQTVTAARRAGVRVLLNFAGPARAALNDAHGAGLPAISERAPDAVARWIGEQLALRSGGGQRQLPLVAVGAAKGGIGK